MKNRIRLEMVMLHIKCKSYEAKATEMGELRQWVVTTSIQSAQDRGCA